MTEGSLNPPPEDFSLQDIDDRTVRLSDYNGKVVILNFFATWCPPCRAEIPDFVKMADEYADDGLVIIGISVGDAGAAKLRGFSADMGINYPLLLDDGVVSRQYGPIRNIPTTFIIDRKGAHRKKIVGSLSKKGFEAIIKPLLAE